MFPHDLNDANVTLIPKCSVPEAIRDLRPIALWNVLYKVIAKVLANRLKIVLLRIISDTQSTFVEGRYIIDNVMVAFEIIH